MNHKYTQKRRRRYLVNGGKEKEKNAPTQKRFRERACVCNKYKLADRRFL